MLLCAPRDAVCLCRVLLPLSLVLIQLPHLPHGLLGVALSRTLLHTNLAGGGGRGLLASQVGELVVLAHQLGATERLVGTRELLLEVLVALRARLGEVLPPSILPAERLQLHRLALEPLVGLRSIGAKHGHVGERLVRLGVEELGALSGLCALPVEHLGARRLPLRVGHEHLALLRPLRARGALAEGGGVLGGTESLHVVALDLAAGLGSLGTRLLHAGAEEAVGVAVLAELLAGRLHLVAGLLAGVLDLLQLLLDRLEVGLDLGDDCIELLYHRVELVGGLQALVELGRHVGERLLLRVELAGELLQALVEGDLGVAGLLELDILALGVERLLPRRHVEGLEDPLVLHQKPALRLRGQHLHVPEVLALGPELPCIRLELGATGELVDRRGEHHQAHGQRRNAETLTHRRHFFLS
mmetsp:Transcript_17613/g.34492  ORF Transcript_17613/g.34492 Transcript_17613/m.34492 type:complete len:415 (+) Transcript_17613:409-1653(+)